MVIALRPLGLADVRAHNAGEDEQTVRWLTGARGTAETTEAHFKRLSGNAKRGQGARGFGVWADDRLLGYVDCDPDINDGLERGDVNITYAVHPRARNRGVASEAVRLICDFIRVNHLGSCAAIRVDPENRASVRVAEKCRFTLVRMFLSDTDTRPDGSPARSALYRLKLRM